MHNVNVYKANHEKKAAKIRPLTIRRDWMYKDTYNCHPINFANTLGYGVYFEDDISFIWDGNRAHGAVPILGKEHVWYGRGEGTVSFVTNLIIKTDENTSLLTMPVPNEFIDGANVISTVLSTSLFTGVFSVVWKLEKPDTEYFIPAGTNIACILPVSIAQFQNSTINMIEGQAPFERIQDSPSYIAALAELNNQGIRPRMYKKGIDHNGNIIGKHEVDELILNVNYDQSKLKDGNL